MNHDIGLWGDLVVGGTTRLIGTLNLGPGDGVATMDVNDDGGGPFNLVIGAGAASADVVIGNDDHAVKIQSPIQAGSGADGMLDATSNTSYDLKLGTSSTLTKNVVIGRSGQTTTVQGSLNLGSGSGEGTLDAKAATGTNDLSLGTGSSTGSVNISRDGQITKVKGNMAVGNSVNPGQIDAFSTAMDLKVGTDTTKDTIISRSGQTAKVKGSVTVGDSSDGKIDATSNSSWDLKLGTESTLTKNVILGRTGQTVTSNSKLSMNGIVQMNSNDLVMGNTSSASTGWGFHVDSGNNRLYIYVNGVQSGYFDSTGFHH